MESTLSSFDQENAVCAVLVDLSKALDCVDRKILLDKLEYIRINRKVHKLLKIYLAERKQFVNFEGHGSD